MTFSRLILSSDLASVGQDPRRLCREAAAGRLVRVRHGVYIEVDHWKDLNDWGRYGVRAAAFSGSTAAPPTYSLHTAGLLWGLWLVGCPEYLHAVTDFKAGGRSRPGLKRHIGHTDAGVTTIFGFRVTDKARTAVELMTRLPFAHAVAVADSSRRTRVDALDEAQIEWKRDLPLGPPPDIDELHAAIRRLPSMAKRQRAEAVLDFSSGLSESAGESISRANMHILGFPPPRLQHRFILARGQRARTDFYWPAAALVGEFDGAGKYLRKDWGEGLSIEDRVMLEKQRENGIRAQGVGVVRCERTDAVDLNRLERILAQAGLRRRCPTPEVPRAQK